MNRSYPCVCTNVLAFRNQRTNIRRKSCLLVIICCSWNLCNFPFYLMSNNVAVSHFNLHNKSFILYLKKTILFLFFLNKPWRKTEWKNALKGSKQVLRWAIVQQDDVTDGVIFRGAWNSSNGMFSWRGLARRPVIRSTKRRTSEHALK